MVETTRPESRTAASGTKTTPSAKSPPSSAATARARRVLPTPPGPVRVTSRMPSRRSSVATAVRSVSRPISGDSRAGTSTWGTAWLGWDRTPTALRDRRRQGGALRLGQAECRGEGADRGRVGMTVLAPLQGADRVRGKPRPLGQLLLGQAGGVTGVSQSRRERHALIAHVGFPWCVHREPVHMLTRRRAHPIPPRRRPVRVDGEVDGKTRWSPPASDSILALVPRCGDRPTARIAVAGSGPSCAN